jgi:hypothetical protein
MDRYSIPNDINMLCGKDIGCHRFASEIKYIRGRHVKRYRLGSVDLGTVDPSAAQRSRKSLPAIPVPTPRSKTMPSLSPNFTGQGPCQAQKIFCWGLLTPGMSQSVRGQENIITTSLVTMQNHYTKTAIPASELRLPLMGIDSRT